MKKLKFTDMKKNLADKRPVIPYTRDMIQALRGNHTTPEIRVWCHPRRINQLGDAYYVTCDTFKEADEFIRGEGKLKGCEDAPPLAFRGYEINIHDLPELIHDDLNQED